MATDLPGRKKGYENSILNAIIEDWVFHHLEILGLYENRAGFDRRQTDKETLQRTS